eukprot:2849494-Rhodomonas_salina.2
MFLRSYAYCDTNMPCQAVYAPTRWYQRLTRRRGVWPGEDRNSALTHTVTQLEGEKNRLEEQVSALSGGGGDAAVLRLRVEGGGRGLRVGA